ncbi:uncharacterized protein [Musca autumnalis]|uniref:uncharacterized protein n=1 Tax=Musca autumnalis TaxID=221902 RepID=UPI003CEAD97E
MAETFLVISLCILLIYAEAKRDFSIEVEDITVNLKDITFIKSLNFSQTNKQTMNMDLIFNRNISKWPARASLYLLTKAKRRISLFQVNFDVCRLLQDRAPNNFLSIFKKELLRTSNVPHRGPFVENVLYWARNYSVNEDAFPSTLPETAWEFVFNINSNDLNAGFFKISGHVRK